MNKAIMNPQLTAYSCLTGRGDAVEDFYERHRPHHLSPISPFYGHVLVEMIPRLAGFQVTLTFNRFAILERPRFSYHGACRFFASALGFWANVSAYFEDRPGRILRDHLAENGALANRG